MLSNLIKSTLRTHLIDWSVQRLYQLISRNFSTSNKYTLYLLYSGTIPNRNVLDAVVIVDCSDNVVFAFDAVEFYKVDSLDIDNVINQYDVVRTMYNVDIDLNMSDSDIYYQCVDLWD